MSGRLVPCIRFPLNITHCQSSRVQIEPILCNQGYGVRVQVVLQKLGNPNKNKKDETFTYERVIFSEIVTQESIPPDNLFYDMIFEFMEGYYYSKIGQDMIISLAAIMLDVLFPDLLTNFKLDLSEYILHTHLVPVTNSKDSMGF